MLLDCSANSSLLLAKQRSRPRDSMVLADLIWTKPVKIRFMTRPGLSPISRKPFRSGPVYTRCQVKRAESATMPEPFVRIPREQPNGSPIRVIIADDERLAREKLRILLSSEPEVQVVAECPNGRQTVSAIRSFRPDMLLLDIQMPDLDGFEVLSEISSDEMPQLIFTSAYDQYAIRAFEAHALDYLLKPFDQDRLHAAIERAGVEIRKSKDQDLTNHVLALLAAVRSWKRPVPEFDKRLTIRTNGRVVFLNLEEVHWIEAAANYVRLNTGKGSYLFRETISRVSERLNPASFVRIHRSMIVNISQIKELIPVNSGEYVVVLHSGKELSCSRGYRANLRHLIGKNS
jgi:two-component system, LytTR family, response regulator